MSVKIGDDGKRYHVDRNGKEWELDDPDWFYVHKLETSLQIVAVMFLVSLTIYELLA